MEIKLSVLGTPRSQPRHRSFQKGRFRGTYDPAKRHKQSFLYSVLDQAPDKLFNEPIMVNLIFYFPRPKSHYGTGKDKNKLKLSAPIYHISTPDIDNLQKFVFDALNKVFCFHKHQ